MQLPFLILKLSPTRWPPKILYIIYLKFLYAHMYLPSISVRFFEDAIKEGEIEVYYGLQWDKICSNGWDINDANVALAIMSNFNRILRSYTRPTCYCYS